MMAGRGRAKGSAKVPGSGRRKGSLNKVTRMHRDMLDRMKVDCTDPMSFAMSILRNPAAPFEERKWACAQLFPYSHPRLASLEARAGGKSHEDRLAELQRLAEDAEDD